MNYKKYKPLIYKLAKKYKSRYIEYEEIVSMFNLKFVELWQTYLNKSDIEFKKILSKSCRNQILNAHYKNMQAKEIEYLDNIAFDNNESTTVFYIELEKYPTAKRLFNIIKLENFNTKRTHSKRISVRQLKELRLKYNWKRYTFLQALNNLKYCYEIAYVL